MASDRTARSVATTVFGFALLLAGGHAVAETGDGATLPTTPVTDEPEGETDLEYEAVVVARREPEDPFLSSRSVSRIGASELSERMPRTMPEALWDAPGAFVQQTNHGGGSPILRGLVGPQVLLLIDGVRLNNSVFRTGPVQYFGTGQIPANELYNPLPLPLPLLLPTTVVISPSPSPSPSPSLRIRSAKNG
jgi:hypothetical protein